jgi:hypothetical protein
VRCAAARETSGRRTTRRRSACSRCVRAFHRFPAPRGDLPRRYCLPACAVPVPVARAGVALRCARHRSSCHRATQLAAASALPTLADKASLLSALALCSPRGRADGVYGKRDVDVVAVASPSARARMPGRSHAACTARILHNAQQQQRAAKLATPVQSTPPKCRSSLRGRPPERFAAGAHGHFRKM